MATGVIKWFDSQRGFGFIRKDDGGPDVLVQRGSLVAGEADRLCEGVVVEFETARGQDGTLAIGVRPIA